MSDGGRRFPRWRRVAVRLAAGVLDGLYPPRCVVRGCAATGFWLCPECRRQIRPLGPACPICALPGRQVVCAACRRSPPACRRIAAAGVYAGPLRDAIRALKYRRVAALADTLAAMAAEAYGHGGGTAPRHVVPVPSHPRRVAARGIDHPRLLAVSVARHLEAPLALRALRRERDTRPQVELSAAMRRQNLAGAFTADEAWPGGAALLVDDVVTTGATVQSAAIALLAAGATTVDACVVARAKAPGSPGGNGRL